MDGKNNDRLNHRIHLHQITPGGHIIYSENALEVGQNELTAIAGDQVTLYCSVDNAYRLDEVEIRRRTDPNEEANIGQLSSTSFSYGDTHGICPKGVYQAWVEFIMPSEDIDVYIVFNIDLNFVWKTLILNARDWRTQRQKSLKCTDDDDKEE